MSRNLGSSSTSATPRTHVPADVPRAVRATRPGWRDPRLWVGVLVVAASVVVGARLLASADDAVGVWATVRDMGAGDTVAPEDLVVRRVRFDEAGDLDRYFTADADVPDGLTLARGVGTGELLARSAVGPDGGAGLLQVPVAVDAEQVPPAVAAGSLVDVYVLPSGGGRCAAGCAPVLTGVTVVSASSVDEGFGATGKRQLVLGVSDEDASSWFRAYAGADEPVVTVVRRG